MEAISQKIHEQNIKIGKQNPENHSNKSRKWTPEGYLNKTYKTGSGISKTIQTKWEVKSQKTPKQNRETKEHLNKTESKIPEHNSKQQRILKIEPLPKTGGLHTGGLWWHSLWPLRRH